MFGRCNVVLLLVSTVGACNVKGTCEADDAEVWYLDADQDGFGDPEASEAACSVPAGYVAGSGDCDDHNDTIRPDAVEVCDGIDNDCDTSVDEDVLPAWYADADGDGYGDPANVASHCDVPTGFVADSSDCDDGNASIHPGAEEACDGRDHDCDGIPDAPAPTTAPTWYLDEDRDGWGQADANISACANPAGYAANPGDCDDTFALVYPGAPEEVNALDDDCDGQADDLGIDDVAAGRLRGSEPGDRAGDEVVSGGHFIAADVPDLGGDDFMVLGGSDYRDIWVLDAAEYSGRRTLDEATEATYRFDWRLSLVGATGPVRDVADEGSGLDDPVFMGALFDVRVAAVYHGGDLSGDLANNYVSTMSLLSAFDMIGQLAAVECGIPCETPSVAVSGDIDGAGRAEVLVGFDLLGDGETGAVGFYRENPAGGLTETDGYLLYGSGTGIRFGSDLATADFDGDLDDDILVGSSEYPGTGEAYGAVDLLTDFTPGTIGYYGTESLDDVALRLVGAVPGANLGLQGSLVQPGDQVLKGHRDALQGSRRTQISHVGMDVNNHGLCSCFFV